MAKKKSNKVKEIEIDFSELDLLYQQCENADGFDGEDAAIMLKVEENKVIGATMIYIPITDEATLEIDLRS